MNSLRQLSKLRVPVLWALAIIGVAACSRFTDSQPDIMMVTPISTGTPEVAYGASLTEWEEATQDDATQTDVEQPADSAEDSTGSENASSVTEEDSGAAEDDSGTEEASDAEEDSGSEDSGAEDNGAEEEAASDEVAISEIGTAVTVNNTVYREILWDGLIPADYSADAIMEKYGAELAATQDGSSEAADLYTKMQEEFNNAPVNEVLDETLVRMPGFITPLNYEGGLITEFLLVPYFGACIHVPPPPVNQTVLVKFAEGEGITPQDSYNPIWVMGKLTTEETTTELASAGYYIEDATYEPYKSP